MPYCPNPDCPHSERTGKPAEFLDGIETCSDCGTELVEASPVKSEEPAEKTKFVLADWHKRVLFTLGILLVYRVIAYVPVPGIDHVELQRYLGRVGGNLSGMFGSLRISILPLGLIPYISAAVVVEVLALVIPSLKRSRQAGYAGRVDLRTVVVITALCFSLFQGLGIAVGLEKMAYGAYISSPGIWFRLQVSLTLTAAMFLLLWLARLISRYGVGHGISIILVASYVSGLPRDLMALRRMNDANQLELAMPVIIFIAIIVLVLIIVVERTRKNLSVIYEDGLEAYIPVKLTTAGIIPVRWAADMVSYPALLAGFIGTPTVLALDNALRPGRLLYSAIYAAMIVLFYYLFSYLFHRPRAMASAMKERGAELITVRDTDSWRYLKSNVQTIAFIGAVYLCIVSILPDILRKEYNLPIYLGGIGFILTVAIAMDIYGEIRALRITESLVKIAEVHDVPTAGLMRSVLEGKGLNCHLRGYYHRALLYFFGPYIEISVMVPEETAQTASDAIGKYVGPEFLVTQTEDG